MKPVFYLAAAAMIAVALALLLVPLVRHGRRQGRPRGIFVLALMVAFALPLGAAGLYLLIGTPVALNGVEKQPEQPLSIALWRNLGGFPDPDPYRSCGVEPMLGRVFDLAEAGPGDAALVPASGKVRWRLTLSSACNCP